MPTDPIPERRRLKRTPEKKRASLVLNTHWGQMERIPCIILESSHGGFRIGGTCRLKRGQIVEIILDEEQLSGVSCIVKWTGNPGSKQQGEAGLQTRANS